MTISTGRETGKSWCATDMVAERASLCRDGIAVKLCCSHYEIQLPPTGTIGCALSGKRCCGGASGRDRVELTQDAVKDQAIMKFGPDAGDDPFVKEKQFYDHCREGDCPGCKRELLLHCVGLRHRAQCECEEMRFDGVTS